MDKSKQETGLEVFLVCRSLLHYIMLALHDLPCAAGNWTFRSQDHSLPGAKVPGVELSLPGPFAPTTEYSNELILRYTKRTSVTHNER